jgi:hypothetical protein
MPERLRDDTKRPSVVNDENSSAPERGIYESETIRRHNTMEVLGINRLLNTVHRKWEKQLAFQASPNPLSFGTISLIRHAIKDLSSGL